MIGVNLASEVDFDGWRAAARAFAAKDAEPRQVVWTVGGGDLFAGFAEAPASAEPSQFRVPRRFLELAKTAICHSDSERFALLYRLLFRLRREKNLLENPADADVSRLERMVKSVSRDRHKMTAFVRFRETVGDAGRPFYAAWFEPEHYIEELAAPFFVDRYAQNDFAIMTPRRSVLFRDGALSFGPGANKSDAPDGDGFSPAWDAYYRSIFNPARLMPNAMRKEMPVKYWRNLPETRQIPAMIAAAAPTVDQFLASPAAPRTRRRAKPPETVPPANANGLSTLRRDAETCRRCDLGAHATQTVFGEGPAEARIMFVGEQPGDQEDLVGAPFVGPAGALFDEAMARAGLSRSEAYVTNAVKHFKFVPRGKKRIHKTPETPEIVACRWWLEKELSAVQAPLVVAMGATALFALTGERGGLLKTRGSAREFRGRRLFVTVHPAYVLRLPDPAQQAAERQRLFDDFAVIARLV
jgi:DNA polymerase